MRTLLTVLIALLFTITAYARTFTVICTNSPNTELNVSDSLEIYPPVEHFVFDEPNTGDHNHNIAWIAQVATNPDKLVYLSGCGEDYWDRTLHIEGDQIACTFENFKQTLNTIAAPDEPFQDQHYKHGSRPLPSIYKMKDGDLLTLYLANVSGLDGQDRLLYYFNHSETAPDSQQTMCCEVSDGDAVLPSQLRQAIERMQGNGHVLVVSMFWSAESFETYWTDWDNCTRIYCAAIGEPLYHVNGESPCGDNEVVCKWEDRNLAEFYLPETFWQIAPVIRWVIGHELPYLISGEYPSPNRFDCDGDQIFSLFEGCLTCTCNDQNTIRCYGEDILNHNMYPLEDELGGEGSPIVEPDIFPNPFNPNTSIKLELKQAGHLELSVFNLLGQRVATLCDAHRNAGQHEFSFMGQILPSGLYFIQARLDGQYSVKKMVLQK